MDATKDIKVGDVLWAFGGEVYGIKEQYVITIASPPFIEGEGLRSMYFNPENVVWDSRGFFYFKSANKRCFFILRPLIEGDYNNLKFVKEPDPYVLKCHSKNTFPR